MAVEQIGTRNDDGSTLGASDSLLSVYGVAPVAQAAAITAATDLTTALVTVTALVAAVKNFGITL